MCGVYRMDCLLHELLSIFQFARPQVDTFVHRICIEHWMVKGCIVMLHSSSVLKLLDLVVVIISLKQGAERDICLHPVEDSHYKHHHAKF
jgi:hypothetical protein